MFTLTTPAVGGTGNITGDIATLAAGVSANFTMVVAVDAAVADGTVISNTATITSATTDPTPVNNSDTETTTVQTQADLAVTKVDTPDPVFPGQNITYTIHFQNNGPNIAVNCANHG